MKRMLSRIFLIFKIKRFFPFLIDYFLSKEVLFRQKIIYILIFFTYLILPFDLIYDYIPLAGLVDDVFVLMFLLQHLIKKAPPHLRDTHKLN
ncbi:YkvA family protein [Bacillus solitudinis]|uniref:YkvA family protein n=1 Tax=Bacillus solitudinis TaxID=2014074 RepID=UPI000C2409C0|nr:DUF1232 domain-containing protein [Bacillus solitudinis]